MIVFLLCMLFWWLSSYSYFGVIGLAWLIISRADNKSTEVKQIRIEGTKHL